MITDDVRDAIAHIEMHRQEMAKEASVAAACNEALRKLHELLDSEREALQLHGPGAGHAASIDAVMAEMERVKGLAGTPAKGTMPKHERDRRQMPLRPAQPHHRPRTKGRRTMGRGGGR